MVRQVARFPRSANQDVFTSELSADDRPEPCVRLRLSDIVVVMGIILKVSGGDFPIAQHPILLAKTPVNSVASSPIAADRRLGPFPRRPTARLHIQRPAPRSIFARCGALPSLMMTCSMTSREQPSMPMMSAPSAMKSFSRPGPRPWPVSRNNYHRRKQDEEVRHGQKEFAKGRRLRNLIAIIGLGVRMEHLVTVSMAAGGRGRGPRDRPAARWRCQVRVWPG